MELTRTKHWSRIWSCVQSIMSPGILLGSGITSYLGKPGFYACAICVLIGAGLIGFHMIDLTKCGSPQLSSSVDNDSPIPPAPPPISLNKYGHHQPPLIDQGGPPGLYPLRRSISLQQPVYPCCREAEVPTTGLGAGLLGMPYPYGPSPYPPGYSPYCRECILSSPLPPAYLMGGGGGGPLLIGGGGGSGQLFYPPGPGSGSMIRSYSLPQSGPLPNQNPHYLKTTGTQTNPNSPVASRSPTYPGSYDRLPSLPGSFLPQDRVIKDSDARNASSSYKNTVMFASNPQLFPASATQSSATSTTDRSATPTYNHNNHNHNHRHNHNNHSPSPRHYYPQREERRANFIKSHQRSFDSQQLSQDSQNQSQPPPPLPKKPQPHPQPQPQRFYPVVATTSAVIETHKKPDVLVTTPKTSEKVEHQQKQQPAFTRHYFDSSKIQKGSGRGTGVGGHSIVNNVNVASTSGSSNINSILRSQQNQNAQYRQPTLPISAINAKLQQYQRQQQKASEVDWRSIQRQSTATFDDDPDPPYYPAQTKAPKVSGSEFQDVEQPKFNSLRRVTPRSTHSSMSSQLNYSTLGSSHHHRSHGGQSQSHTPMHNHGNGGGGGHGGQGQSQSHSHTPNHHHSGGGHGGQNGRNSYNMSYQPQPGHSGHLGHGHHGHGHHQSHHQSHSHNHSHSQEGRRQGNINSGNSGGNISSRDDCPYCDPRNAPPPLSLSVPALQQSDPHYMCHYGYGGPPLLKRRNTWHHHRDQLEAITTSV